MSSMAKHERKLRPVILQQRCLHHVTTLCIRNLTMTLQTDGDSSVQLQFYFTLHPAARYALNDSQVALDELYRSKSIRYCCNPTWNYLDVPKNEINFSEFIVRLWIGTTDDYMPALQWNVSLPQLNCVGDALHSEKLVFHCNAIALGMHGKYYSSTSSVTLHPPLNSLQAYDFGEAKNSYSVFALNRLLSVKKSVKKEKDQIAYLYEKSKEILEKEQKAIEIKMELEQLSNRIEHMKILLQRENTQLHREKEEAQSFKMQMENKELKEKENRLKLQEELTNFGQDQESSIETKLQVSQLVKLLGLRRRDILAELSHIFPILCSESDKNQSSSKKPLIERVYTICGVKLPQSDSFNQKEDLQTTVALGYTAQLLNMMSLFLLVPLRYPVVSKNSLSCVVDHVTEKLIEKERMFPLHVKGNKDRFVSDYGVFLLNKNVAQLRYYCGLGTPDLRPTLENIRSLLEERLGAKPGGVGHKSQPIDIFSPSKEIIRPEKSMNKSPGGDIPTPSSGYVSHVSSDAGAKLSQVSQSESFTSPRRQAKRLGSSRRNELKNLRGELFGSNDHRKSPKHQSNVPKINAANHPANDLFNNTVSKAPDNNDSIESVSYIPPTNRIVYTGLEEIGQSTKKDTKMSYNSARAELLGRRATQLSNDPAIRKNWSVSKPLTGNLLVKRSELFKRLSPQKERFEDIDSESPKSETSNVSSESFFDNFDNVERSNNSDVNNLTSKVFSEPEVCIIDPSKSRLKLMDESDEELDLC